MASATKDPNGNLTANPFATGQKKFGAGQGTAATSGSLPKAGFAARDRKKKARSNAIKNMIAQNAPAAADPNASTGKSQPPWLQKKG
jgi:hypothetical protein